ncbi:FAV3 [Candida pseudojiufengensis]|uniref:FAV3 n=1 Tax=Candida pseudojiufengensis TaxID=497109 RepID=UPI0022244EC3|nr:FAV3 [Candida pseudojiufengensis]KAI5960625.1 FAV3 [Candida pseudojiufengensis]
MIQLLLSLIIFNSLTFAAPIITQTVIVTAPIKIVTITIGQTEVLDATTINSKPIETNTATHTLQFATESTSSIFNQESSSSYISQIPSSLSQISSTPTTTLSPSSFITSTTTDTSTSSESFPQPSVSTINQISNSNPILSKAVSSTPQSGYAYMSTINKIWQRFWQKGNWNQNDGICEGTSFVTPPVWSLAVLGKAITNTGDSSGTNTIISSILKYFDESTGAFFDYPNSGKIYTDDNAQLMWVFTDAYKITNNQEYLKYAENILNYLRTQNFNNKGGILWTTNGNYIASISTVETALAAIRLYEVNGDESLIDTARECMDFMFDYFQDPNDKLFYDGLDKTAFDSVNKGKLTYTVGCAISTLSKLYHLKNDNEALSRAIELANAATKIDGAFYTVEKVWNNSLKYSHSLFAGFGDAFKSSSEFDQFKPEVIRQANYIYEFLNDPHDQNLYFDAANDGTTTVYNKYASVFGVSSDYTPSNSIFCNNNSGGPTSKDFLINASAAQILYHLANY